VGARRILVSDATSYKAVVVTAFLKSRYPHLRVFTSDWRRGSRALHTRRSDGHFVLRHRLADGAAYAEELRRLCESLAIDLLFPVNRREMDLLIGDRDAFGGRLSYVGDREAYESLNRKDRLSALARECGVRVPETFPDARHLRLPAVAKPVASSAAKGVRYLFGDEDVRRFLAQPPTGEHVFQEYVVGQGAGYSVFADEGRVLVGHGHRRLAEFPVSGGSSVYRESCPEPAMAEAAARIVARARWSGFAMFEFKRTAAGEHYLLEANPRIWGSINQGLQSGANYFEPLLGPAAGPGPVRPHVRTYLSPLLYAALAGYAVKGDLRPLGAFLGSISRNRADIGLVQDPRAWLGSVLRVG
jgi:hypothetical protein